MCIAVSRRKRKDKIQCTYWYIVGSAITKKRPLRPETDTHASVTKIVYC